MNLNKELKGHYSCTASNLSHPILIGLHSGLEIFWYISVYHASHNDYSKPSFSPRLIQENSEEREKD